MSPEPSMALRATAVSHRYGGFTALDDVTLEIAQGELVTLLGPSGCGKTTLLRSIAGFVRPSKGRIVLDGADVTAVPPHKRPVNMVFQRPTLFPHLDVFDNVAFGLRVGGAKKAEVRPAVTDALELVRLADFAQRRSDELSGGQMQRVALARALVNRPKLLLLDEPLSALDLKIRLEMEVELRRVHRETGATFVYVTHDQREALALSDRIAVMNGGRIEQLARPDDIYSRPATPFAARFVGDANLLPVTVTEVASGRASARVAGQELSVPCGEDRAPGPAWLVLRPEALRVLRPDASAARAVIEAKVVDLAFRGTGFSYRLAVAGLAEPLKAELPPDADAPREVGQRVTLCWDADACWLLGRGDQDDGVEAVDELAVNASG